MLRHWREQKTERKKLRKAPAVAGPSKAAYSDPANDRSTWGGDNEKKRRRGKFRWKLLKCPSLGFTRSPKEIRAYPDAERLFTDSLGEDEANAKVKDQELYVD